MSVSFYCAYLGGEVLEDGGRVDGGGGTHAAVGRGALLEVTVKTTDGELRKENGNKGKDSGKDRKKGEGREKKETQKNGRYFSRPCFFKNVTGGAASASHTTRPQHNSVRMRKKRRRNEGEHRERKHRQNKEAMLDKTLTVESSFPPFLFFLLKPT